MSTGGGKDQRRLSALFQSRPFEMDQIGYSIGALSIDPSIGLIPQPDRRRRRLTSFTKIADDINNQKSAAQNILVSPIKQPLNSLFFSPKTPAFEIGFPEVESSENCDLEEGFDEPFDKNFDLALEVDEDAIADLHLTTQYPTPKDSAPRVQQDTSASLQQQAFINPVDLGAEEKSLSDTKLFDSPDVRFASTFMSFGFTNSLTVSSNLPVIKTANSNPFSNVVESSDLYNLDLEEYYSATSSQQTPTFYEEPYPNFEDKNAKHTGLKRNKCTTRAESKRYSQIKADYREKASMTCSLENAPVLKLRRRVVERRAAKPLLKPKESTRVLSEQIRAHRSVFNNPFLSANGKTRNYLDNRQPHANWIGSYSPKKRKVLLTKFLDKRKHRVWNKKIRYAVRKNFADSRLRVKGRFVGKDQEAILRDCLVTLI